jgi:hypothetical protein
MELTPNNNIKIVRLQSGEDIMADVIQHEENDTILLENPMHIIFKRIPTGQTVMMMMPWLPIEIIKENNAIIYGTDILTIIEPKDDLVEYYGNVVVEAQQKMSEQRNFNDIEDDEEDYDIEEDEISSDELLEILKEKKKNNLH